MAKTARANYPANASIRGVAVTPRGQQTPRIKNITIMEASHPFPDKTSAAAAREVQKTVRSAKRGDFVLALISGGASSLLGAPVPGMHPDDYRALLARLINKGADIRELNAVRRKISACAGGRLATICKAPALALICSDVVNGTPPDIASGPFAPAVIPAKAGIHTIIENRIIASATLSLAAAEKVLKKSGATVINIGECAGEARQMAKAHAKQFRKQAASKKTKKPIAFLSGGEATSKAGGKNTSGGANCEYALAYFLADNNTDYALIACDTDGTDGTANAAGALFDGKDKTLATKKNLPPKKYQTNRDSATFFAKLNALIKTGNTKINTNDFRTVLFF